MITLKDIRGRTDRKVEAFQNFRYKVPDDPELILYDFYFLTGIAKFFKTQDENFNFVIDEVVDYVVQELIVHMRRAVKFSIACEMRHIFDRVHWSKGDKVYKKYKEFIMEYYKEYQLQRGAGGSLPFSPTEDNPEEVMNRIKDVQQTIKDNSNERENAYRALQIVQRRLKVSNQDLADMTEDFFNNLSWSSGFGSKAWGGISKGYKMLLNANNMKKQIIAIDHAYDLQHNTDTVFNKIQVYSKNGYGWLIKALNWKRDLEDIRDFYDRVSTQLKPIVAYIAKNAFGLTIEDKLGQKATPTKAPSGSSKKITKNPTPQNSTITNSLGMKFVPLSTPTGLKSTYRVEWWKPWKNCYVSDSLFSALTDPALLPDYKFLTDAELQDAEMGRSGTGVIFKQGLWKNGNFERGEFRDGTFMNGTFSDKANWFGGTWIKGTFHGKEVDNSGKKNKSPDPKDSAKAKVTINGKDFISMKNSNFWKDVYMSEDLMKIWQTELFWLRKCELENAKLDLTFDNGDAKVIFVSGTWKDGWWKDGIWKSGDWETGKWSKGEWLNGIWKNGEWKNGEWFNGTWEDGTWVFGKWYDGLWKNGLWKNGTWKQGDWRGGVWKNGTWWNGLWNTGTWEGGTWHDGTFISGTFESGKWIDGEFHKKSGAIFGKDATWKKGNVIESSSRTENSLKENEKRVYFDNSSFYINNINSNK